MFKKLMRIGAVMIFASFMAMNVSIALASVAAEAAGDTGNKYDHQGSPTLCICGGDECRPCLAIPQGQ